MPDKSQNAVLDEDGEELTPHGSVENLYIPNDKSFHRSPLNTSGLQNSNNSKTGQYQRSISHQINTTSGENPMNQNHITQLRRSTSMSNPSPGGQISSTKTVTFTLPMNEGYQVCPIISSL